jgi:hypothetical protein
MSKKGVVLQEKEKHSEDEQQQKKNIKFNDISIYRYIHRINYLNY